jgi:hypothetical protein
MSRHMTVLILHVPPGTHPPAPNRTYGREAAM